MPGPLRAPPGAEGRAALPVAPVPATVTASCPKASGPRGGPDSRDHDGWTLPRLHDVLVVGAGPSGLLFAEALAHSGLSVAVIDAGPSVAPGYRVPEVDPRQWPFTVADGGSFDWYRVRAVGGRTHLWGGWSHRLPRDSMERAGWPARSRGLDAFYDEVERRIGVVEGVLEPRIARLARELGVSVVPKRGALHPDGTVFRPLRLRAARKVRDRLVALSLEHRAREAVALRCFDLRTGRVVACRARAFVLAASPIETARVLLSSEIRGPGARAIGRNLVDHMVATYVLIEPLPPPPAGGRGPFPGAALVPSFVNRGPGTERPYGGGFSIELNGPFDLATFGLERLASTAEGRGLRATQISAIGECLPHDGRYVDLDPDRTDAAGAAVARLHVPWSPSEEALAADLRQACSRLADALAPPGSRLMKFHDPLLPGAGHEAGTCRMGGPEDPCTADGRLRALRNVFIADAGALPTAGDRHPTLTVLAHALRTARAVQRELAAGHRVQGGVCKRPVVPI